MNKRFLIVEPDPIILLDLQGIIRAAFPDCDVMTRDSFQSGQNLDFENAAHFCVFVGSAAITSDIQPALADLVARGGKVIIVGSTVPTEFPVSTVDLPFSAEMITAAIISALPGAMPPPPAGRTGRLAS